MNTNINDPKDPRKKEYDPAVSAQPDVTPRREGGDDSLAESNPTDSRSDEKVIVNEQRGNKTVNGASQTDANSSESIGSDEDILD
jgi:hypothetical protein